MDKQDLGGILCPFLSGLSWDSCLLSSIWWDVWYDTFRNVQPLSTAIICFSQGCIPSLQLPLCLHQFTDRWSRIQLSRGYSCMGPRSISTKVSSSCSHWLPFPDLELSGYSVTSALGWIQLNQELYCCISVSHTFSRCLHPQLDSWLSNM